ncbi:hypothetical protein D3C80_795390 [compost metagenome]
MRLEEHNSFALRLADRAFPFAPISLIFVFNGPFQRAKSPVELLSSINKLRQTRIAIVLGDIATSYASLELFRFQDTCKDACPRRPANKIQKAVDQFDEGIRVGPTFENCIPICCSPLVIDPDNSEQTEHHQLTQGEPHPVLQHQPDHAQSRAAQGVGVAGAGGLFVDGEEADQGVQLLGDGDGDRDRGGRDAVAWTLRLVVVAHGVGDGVGVAGQTGVVAAHDPLQFRELAHHARGQVGLGQARGLFGLRRVGADQRGDLARQGGDAVDPLGQRAELGVEGHALQLVVPGVEADLLVFVPEEAGVVQAGRQDAAVAGGQSLAAVGRLDVGDDEEVGGETVLGRVAHGEILLVHLHRQADHFGRQRQELRVHVAQDRRRPFGQTGDLVQQAVVIDQSQTARGAGGLGPVQNAQLAIGHIDQNEVAFQLGAIVGEVLDRERLAAAEEAMPLSHVAAVDAVDLERHHRPVEQGDDALDRAHPAQASRAPAHRLGPGEAANDLIHGLGEDLGRLTALAADLGEPDAVALDQLVLGQAGLAQEAFQRLSGGRGLGTLDLFIAVFGGGRQAVDHQRQAARPGEDVQRLPAQARGLQTVGDHAFQVARGALLHAGGDFFGEDFEKKLGHQFSSRTH